MRLGCRREARCVVDRALENGCTGIIQQCGDTNDDAHSQTLTSAGNVFESTRLVGRDGQIPADPAGGNARHTSWRRDQYAQPCSCGIASLPRIRRHTRMQRPDAETCSESERSRSDDRHDGYANDHKSKSNTERTTFKTGSLRDERSVVGNCERGDWNESEPKGRGDDVVIIPVTPEDPAQFTINAKPGPIGLIRVMRVHSCCQSRQRSLVKDRQSCIL